MPYTLAKLVVNDPTLCRPTITQISATDRSVWRSNAAARSRRRVCRYERGRFAERPGEHPTEMGPRQPGGGGQIVDGDRLGVAGVDQILGPLQITGRRHLRHAANYGVFAELPPEAVRLWGG